VIVAAVCRYLPQDIVVVSQEEPLSVIMDVIDHPNTCHEVYDFSGRCVEKIVAALMAPVAIYPLQAKLTLRCSLIRH